MAKNQLNTIDAGFKDQLSRRSVLKSVGEKPGNPEPFSERKKLPFVTEKI